MSDWQPARFIHAHPAPDDKPIAIENLKKMVLRVRPMKPDDRVLAEYRRMGCTARRFFEAHYEDAARAHGAPQRGSATMCEHEILTD